MILNENYTSRVVGEETWQITDRFGNHCYLLAGRRMALLIDAAIGLPGLRACVEALTERPVSVALTHGHLDHIGGAGLWAHVMLHGRDRDVLELHQSAGYRRRIEGLAAECGVKLSAEELQACIYLDEIPRPSQLREGMAIDLGGRALEIIGTPGHTGGSVCLLERKRGFLFSGDTVCQKRVMLSFAESEKPGVYAASVRRLLGETGTDLKIFPGHNESPVGREYLENYLRCARELEELHLHRNRTQEEAQRRQQGAERLSWKPQNPKRGPEELPGKELPRPERESEGIPYEKPQAQIWEEVSVFGRCLVYRSGDVELTFTEAET